MVKKPLPWSNGTLYINALFNLCLCKAIVKYDTYVSLFLQKKKVWIHMLYIGKGI